MPCMVPPCQQLQLQLLALASTEASHTKRGHFRVSHLYGLHRALGDVGTSSCAQPMEALPVVEVVFGLVAVV